MPTTASSAKKDVTTIKMIAGFFLAIKMLSMSFGCTAPVFLRNLSRQRHNGHDITGERMRSQQ
jgi:hypothetical protein